MSDKIHSIQALRGVAAWFVALGHFVAWITIVAGSGSVFERSLRFTEPFKHAGVDVFFVISGAIMVSIVTANRSGRSVARDVFDFIVRRFFRIFPLLWTVIALSLLAKLVLPSWGFVIFPATLSELFSSAFAIRKPPELAVAWTLVFEVRFYLLVAVTMVVFRRRMNSGFLTLAGFFFSYALLNLIGVVTPNFFNDPMMIDFAIGIVVGLLYKNGIAAPHRALLLVGVLWFATSVIMLPNFEPRDIRVLAFGMPSALILLGILYYEKAGCWPCRSFIERAGDESYSVYLWHWVIGSLLFHVWTVDLHWTGTSSAITFLVVVFFLTVVVGRMSFILLEQTFVKLGKAFLAQTMPLVVRTQS